MLNLGLALLGGAILCSMLEAFEVAGLLVVAAVALLHWV
jgi:hypothetical protein